MHGLATLLCAVAGLAASRSCRNAVSLTGSGSHTSTHLLCACEPPFASCCIFLAYLFLLVVFCVALMGRAVMSNCEA